MTALLKPLNESPAMPTAGPQNFMTAGVRRFCSKIWNVIQSSGLCSVAPQTPFVKPLEPDKKPPGTEMFDRRHPLALRRRRPVALVQGAVTCFDYLAANPFMQLWEADLELGR